MRQAIYTATVFVTSGAALVLEIVAGRLIAPYVGMSLYTWTAIIAVILAGLSAGHWIGGRLASDGVDPKVMQGRIAGALALSALFSLLSLVLLRVISANLLKAGLNPVASIVLLTGLLFFMPSLFVGVVSPVATKLALDDRPHETGQVLGRMFAVGAMGSIFGTLAAGYLLISWIGSTGTVVAVAVIYAVLGAGFAYWARTHAAWAAGGLAAFAALFWWGTSAKALTSPCMVESDYFCIRMDDFSRESGRPSRLMVLDHLVHSINDRDEPGILYSPYVHFVDEYAALRFRPLQPVNAFFIGGGGYTLPRAWAKNYPGGSLIVAEIDPAVTQVARSDMWLKPWDRQLTILHQDARRALRDLPADKRFDVVFGDAFHDITVPPHLVTREFHGEIKRRLTPEGFYVVNAVDLGRDPKFLFSLVKTLRLDFKAVEVWKVLDEIDETGRVTFIVVATDKALPRDKITSAFGLVRDWVRWPVDDLSARSSRIDLPVLTDDFAPIDRLMSDLLLTPE
ncbi:MAG: fused MFS/spermidine synthase [Rhodospirillaceae bacterium]